MQPTETCDVLVIGGGPAGSTISTYLRREGWNVVLLEKDQHPRFHIGESLLPRNLPIFDELGVAEKVRNIGVLKHGADFTLPGESRHVLADFADALEPSPPTAYQVKRAEFDEVLLRHAAESGVVVHERTKATAIRFEGEEKAIVESRNDAGETKAWEARFLVDASGRDTFLGNRFDLKVKNPNHESAAIFAHFENVKFRPGDEAGNISMYFFKYGWYWFIPLRGSIMSIGAVCRPAYLKSRKVEIKQFLMDTLALCPELTDRIRGATLASDVMTAGNFSYDSKRMYDKNYLLVGDAYAFIDPVFSTGVFLAMSSARSGAATITACLRNPASRRRRLADHQRRVRRWLRTYSWFIYRFTSPAMKRLITTQRNPLGLKSAAISILSGDTTMTPSRMFRITAFKTIYYLFTLQAWQQSRDWRRHVQVLRTVETAAE
ncbi:MAG TPA: NAD(P)/FAD-dependent oxidoreductase [Verrucomicrobiae bacterium]|nr:NAD(P)/FAD-dependent oxidoreductase [Verrucomicrobiae bacterium]